MQIRQWLITLLMVGSLTVPHADEPVGLEVIHRIKDEASNRSAVMVYLFYLTAATTLIENGADGPGLEVWGSAQRAWNFTRASEQMKEPVDSSIPARHQQDRSSRNRSWLPAQE